MTAHAGTGHPDSTPRTDAELTAIKRVRVQSETGARQVAYRQARDRLADFIADGGSINEYVRVHQLDRRGVQKAWKRICDDLGWQAS